jgi:hypothetical protein
MAGDGLLHGCFSGVSNSDYHRGPGLSASGLKKARTMAHLRGYLDRPEKDPTASQRLGSAVHAAVLEPEIFCLAEVVPNLVAKEHKARAEAARAEGRMVMVEKEYKKAVAMRDAVMNHPTASKLFVGGHAESACFWRDGDLIRKCKPDYQQDGGRIIVDLKTFGELGESDHDLEALERQLFKQRYHWQAAWYCDIMTAVVGEPVNLFYHVFVEEPDDAEHDHAGVRVVALHDAALEKAREDYTGRLEQIRQAFRDNKWPSYNADVIMAGLPSYVW